MRVKDFTFKKTKRIKQVTEHRGICIDLTEQEAADLRKLVGTVGGRAKFKTELCDKLYWEIGELLTKPGVTSTKGIVYPEPSFEFRGGDADGRFGRAVWVDDLPKGEK